MKRCHYTSQQEATEIKDEIDKSTIATVYKNQRLAYGKK